MQPLTYIELDTEPFLDGSPASDPVTWRFAKRTAALPRTIDAVPSLLDVQFQPAVISLGENLGERATLSLRFEDHRHILGPESFDSGTFWGKWRARYGTRLRGAPLRWITGEVGQALADMETWHFVVESTNGPTPDSIYTIVAQDVLKLADGDRALAPRPTDGFLVGGIDTDDTGFTLGPSGIGDAQYAASGYLNLGGKEVVAFTRAGDAVTIARSGIIPGFTYETEVSAHQAGTRAQQCLAIISQNAANILRSYFVDHAGIPDGYVPIDDWLEEVAAFLGTVYTTLICEPTGVNKLASELIQQAALSTWWDARSQLLRLRALRNIATSGLPILEREMLKGSLQTEEQPDKRLSEVLTYYGLRNPLKPIDQPDNYRSALLGEDLAGETAYGGVVNKTIFSRYINFGGGIVANRLNALQIGRFTNPPRKINFNLSRAGERVPEPGAAYKVGWRQNQNIDGTAGIAVAQVTRLARDPTQYGIELEELLVSNLDEEFDFNRQRTITIDNDIYNINLKQLHDAIYPPLTLDDIGSPGVSILCIVNANVKIGSVTTGAPAMDIGSWPLLPPITLRLFGRIDGKGGNSGGGGNNAGGPAPGVQGGTALYLRVPIFLERKPGSSIAGGGGGGGGGGGAYFSGTSGSLPPSSYPIVGGGGGGAGAGNGQGAGAAGAVGVNNAFTGTPTGTDGSGDAANTLRGPGPKGLGGISSGFGITVHAGDGGDGGDLGSPGAPGQPATTNTPSAFALQAGAAGGPAGYAADGNSYITQTEGGGSVLGPTVN